MKTPTTAQPFGLDRYHTADLAEAVRDAVLLQCRARSPGARMHPIAMAALQDDRLDDLSIGGLAHELGRRDLAASQHPERAGARHLAVMAGASTSDFRSALADTCRGLVAKSFEVATDHREFAQIVESPDLRTFTLADAVGDEVDAVNESGEYATSSVTTSEGQSLQVSRFGRILSVSPDVLINDELASVWRAVDSISSSAGRLEARLLTGLLAGVPALPDGPMFDATNSVAVGDPFNVAGFSAATALLRGQRAAPGGHELNLKPRFVLTNPAHEWVVRQILALCGQTADVTVYPHPALSPGVAYWLAGSGEHAALGLCFLGRQDRPVVTIRPPSVADSLLSIKVEHYVGGALLGRTGIVRVTSEG
ncbi:phage major capsid protein [Methylolobus aquaticus]